MLSHCWIIQREASSGQFDWRYYGNNRNCAKTNKTICTCNKGKRFGKNIPAFSNTIHLSWSLPLQFSFCDSCPCCWVPLVLLLYLNNKYTHRPLSLTLSCSLLILFTGDLIQFFPVKGDSRLGSDKWTLAGEVSLHKLQFLKPNVIDEWTLRGEALFSRTQSLRAIQSCCWFLLFFSGVRPQTCSLKSPEWNYLSSFSECTWSKMTQGLPPEAEANCVFLASKASVVIVNSGAG